MRPSTEKSVLILVENLPLPFDRRVWQEALTLKRAGYTVSVICPQGKGYEAPYVNLEGVHIYRHPLPFEGSGLLGYLLEYGTALFWELYLSIKILRRHGFSVIQACNPPDLLFLVGLFHKLLFKKRFVFDHHDINPELYLAKFGRKDFLYKTLLLQERLTFKCADWSIATNESYRAIALTRGGMSPERVTVVRSGPSLERMKRVPPDPGWRNGRAYLVGYLGVMGKQEGIDHLLEAARVLVHERGRKDIQFVLVGGGTELGTMKALSEQLQLNEHVTFTGRIPDEELLVVLSTADVCVNPDIPNEMNEKSTMNKVMEYMAMGKPIVQYDLFEGRFSAQEASLYARPNDINDFASKIEALLDDRDLRKRMGDYGHARVVQELNWEVEAPKYLQVYERLLGPDGKGNTKDGSNESPE
jgi:glycosyltransferase involved in cell wall biosynthesis